MSRHVALALYKQIKETHADIFLKLTRLKDTAATSEDCTELVDMVACLKKAEDLARDMRYEIEKTYQKLEHVTCVRYIQQGLLGEPIRSEWVTGSPNSKSIPILPTKKGDPVAYGKLCAFFGVPDDDVFRPNWPALSQKLSEMQAQLKPLPPGIDPEKMIPAYTVKCLFKQDIDSLCESELV
jgi:hypothetical protein